MESCRTASPPQGDWSLAADIWGLQHIQDTHRRARPLEVSKPDDVKKELDFTHL